MAAASTTTAGKGDVNLDGVSSQTGVVWPYLAAHRSAYGGSMTNIENDPTRHWDGSRWLMWDGQVWRDESTGQPVTAAATTSSAALQVTSAPSGGQTYGAVGYYRTNVTALGVKEGQLAAVIDGDNSRLTFITNSGETLFDGQLSSFHSLGLTEWDSTLELWHNDQRHRVCMTPGGPLVGNMKGAYVGNTEASKWFEVLKPYVGEKPADVKVRKPMSRSGYVVMNIAVVVLVLLVAFVIVVFVL